MLRIQAINYALILAAEFHYFPEKQSEEAEPQIVQRT